MLEYLKQIDQELLLLINGCHSPFFDNLMWLISAKLTWVPFYASILYILIKNFNLKLTFITVICITLVIVYCDQMCATVLRPIFERLRPSNLDNPISEFIHIVNNKRGGKYGFPSCHASNTFGLAVFLVLFFKQRSITIFSLFWATIVSYSRSYLGVHYPGDLLAGALVGLSGGTLVYYFYKTLLKINFIINFTEFYGKNRTLILEPNKIKHTSAFIYSGILSILAFAVYSLF